MIRILHGLQTTTYCCISSSLHELVALSLSRLRRPRSGPLSIKYGKPRRHSCQNTRLYLNCLIDSSPQKTSDRRKLDKKASLSTQTMNLLVLNRAVHHRGLSGAALLRKRRYPTCRVCRGDLWIVIVTFVYDVKYAVDRPDLVVDLRQVQNLVPEPGLDQ